MKKAVVFAGGGTKGAYQIGAWKALDELGESFDIATGTSIGSINAGFYVQHDYAAAAELWDKLNAQTIMANGINPDISLESILSQRENLIPFIKNYINYKGADVTPFHNEMTRYFSSEKFFSSDIDFALMTVRFPGLEPCEITKEKMAEDKENAWKWVAASCACFPVFPVMEIGGQPYIDGGYYDNIPVASAFKLGAENAVVIDLKTDNNHESYIHHPRVKYIKPSRDLGNFMNFEREVIERSIKLGYNDTMKAYGRYRGYLYTFLPDKNGFEKADRAAQEFVSVLTQMEAAFDFSGKLHFQRVNKLEGCTTILADYCGLDKPDEADIFTAALELFLKTVKADDMKNYNIDELLFNMKTEFDRLYPLLEFDVQSAFEKVRSFIKNYPDIKNADIKKIDEDRMMLILTAFVRALQRAKI